MKTWGKKGFYAILSLSACACGAAFTDASDTAGGDDTFDGGSIEASALFDSAADSLESSVKADTDSEGESSVDSSADSGASDANEVADTNPDVWDGFTCTPIPVQTGQCAVEPQGFVPYTVPTQFCENEEGQIGETPPQCQCMETYSCQNCINLIYHGSPTCEFPQ